MVVSNVTFVDGEVALQHLMPVCDGRGPVGLRIHGAVDHEGLATSRPLGR